RVALMVGRHNQTARRSTRRFLRPSCSISLKERRSPGWGNRGSCVTEWGKERANICWANKLVVEISELVETAVQFTRALPLLFSHVVTTCESAPPEMRLRIASPPSSGEATAVFLVRLCLDLSDACIHFATRPLAFYVAALVALFKLKTLCRGGKGSTTTH